MLSAKWLVSVVVVHSNSCFFEVLRSRLVMPTFLRFFNFYFFIFFYKLEFQFSNVAVLVSVRHLEVGAKRKIARPGPGLNFGWPSFATPSAGLVSHRSIEGLKRTHTLVDKSRLMPVLWTVNWWHNLTSQTKSHCEPLVAVWLRPSTTEPCICCKQVAEKPSGEHLKCM